LHPPYNVTWILIQPFYEYSNAITIIANDFRLLNLTIVIASPGGYISARAIGKWSKGNIIDNISGGLISLKGSSNVIAQNHVQRIILEYGESNTISNNACKKP